MCRECGKEYDSWYNKATSANLCRLEHRVETSKDVRGTGWECDECGQVWVHDSDNCIDADDFGYCYEGLHEASDERQDSVQRINCVECQNFNRGLYNVAQCQNVVVGRHTKCPPSNHH